MEILQRPATELIAMVGRGERTAETLVAAHLDRIGALNSRLNAFVELDADRALADARAQDHAAATGRTRGPLGGLPVSVKSAIGVTGLKVEVGSPTRRGQVADADAVLVARLRAAGAIVLGTTNVAEMLMGYESDNPLYGPTRNPWDLHRTPGGSSGGEAAAIAAGCSAAGLGSDGGGSIRVPAHFTGICGLKPTPGRLPGTGHQPACVGPFSLLGVVGPMARSVGDLAVILAALTGWDSGDPMAVPVLRTAAPAVLEDITVGYFEEDGRTPVTEETRRAVRQAAGALSAVGARVERFLPEGLDRARELWNVFFCEMALEVLQEPLQGAERGLPILEEFLRTQDPAGHRRARGLLPAWLERDGLRADLLRQMTERRVLVCPVASVPAFRHGERSWSIGGRETRYLDAMSYTQWFNVLGLPAAVVPVGRSPEGLPIGVQVVGRPFEEELVLTVAAAIERGGGYRPPQAREAVSPHG